jgi:hypothetical protein
MANGIDDLFQQEDQGGGITDIIEAGKNQVAIKAKEILDSFDSTGLISSQINPMDLRRLGEALASGNEDAANSIIINEISEMQEVLPAGAIQAFGNAIGVNIFNNPVGTTLAAATLTKKGLDKFARGMDTLSGIDVPGDNIFSSGIENALGLANQGVQYGVNKFGQIVDIGNTNYQNLLNKAIFDTSLYSGVRRATDALTDPLFNFQLGVPNLFARKKDKPDPPVIIQQPIVTPTNTGGTGGGGGADASSPDFPIIGGGQGGNQGGNQGGGGNVVIGSSFTPPSTNVSEETKRIEDILDRRSQGSSQGFNMGGLATVARYLKGR